MKHFKIITFIIVATATLGSISLNAQNQSVTQNGTTEAQLRERIESDRNTADSLFNYSRPSTADEQFKVDRRIIGYYRIIADNFNLLVSMTDNNNAKLQTSVDSLQTIVDNTPIIDYGAWPDVITRTDATVFDNIELVNIDAVAPALRPYCKTLSSIVQIRNGLDNIDAIIGKHSALLQSENGSDIIMNLIAEKISGPMETIYELFSTLDSTTLSEEQLNYLQLQKDRFNNLLDTYILTEKK